jgi:taspase (threonine aspartase 1)
MQSNGLLVPPMYDMQMFCLPVFHCSFLAGDGAYRYAQDAGLVVFPIEDRPLSGPLVTHDAIERYHDLLARCQSADLNDTVGAVVIDANENIAAGVSTGGISLKIPGRVGDTPVFGAGCWAQVSKNRTPGFACSSTGIQQPFFLY